MCSYVYIYIYSMTLLFMTVYIYITRVCVKDALRSPCILLRRNIISGFETQYHDVAPDAQLPDRERAGARGRRA